jgi:hypothetical protein
MEVPHVQTMALAHSLTNVVHTYPWLCCLFSLLAPSSYSDTDLARIVLLGGGMTDAVTWNNESNVVTMNCNARSAGSGCRRVLFRTQYIVPPRHGGSDCASSFPSLTSTIALPSTMAAA